jgi:hypothetical protein
MNGRRKAATHVTLMAATTCGLISTAAWSAEGFHLRGAWWQGPGGPGRHTSFVATFDHESDHDADHARGERRAGGGGMEAATPGKHGQATRIVVSGGHLHYRAEKNFNPQHGTIRMLIKGEVWRDATPRWLFEARGRWGIGIRPDPRRLSLLFSVVGGVPTPVIEPEPICRLDLPVENVSTDEWHSVVASWDRARNRGWIALDGRGVTGELNWPDNEQNPYVFYVGGSHEARRRGRNEPGLQIDELVIYDRAMPMLEAMLRSQRTHGEGVLRAVPRRRSGLQPPSPWSLHSAGDMTIRRGN